MKKRALIVVSMIVVVLGIVLAILSLKKTAPIVGEWSRLEQVLSTSNNSVTGFVFRNNGKYESYRLLTKDGKTEECRTYGTWTVAKDGTLTITISDTTLNGKSDYHEENDYSKNLLKRDRTYTKSYKNDISAKNRDSVRCYYVEDGILYIDGNFYKDKLVSEKNEKETGDIVPEDGFALQYEMNYILLNPSGTYEVRDVTGSNYFQFGENGHYLMYKNKLILRGLNNRMELQFYKDGDNWIYDAESSYGLVRMDKISDLAIFTSTGMAEE